MSHSHSPGEPLQRLEPGGLLKAVVTSERLRRGDYLSLVIIIGRWELAFFFHPHLPNEECLAGGDPTPNSTKKSWGSGSLKALRQFHIQYSGPTLRGRVSVIVHSSQRGRGSRPEGAAAQQVWLPCAPDLPQDSFALLQPLCPL